MNRVEDVSVPFVLKETGVLSSAVTVGRVSTARLLGMCGNHG
jgi:hypothetical protein